MNIIDFFRNKSNLFLIGGGAVLCVAVATVTILMINREPDVKDTVSVAASTEQQVSEATQVVEKEPETEAVSEKAEESSEKVTEATKEATDVVEKQAEVVKIKENNNVNKVSNKVHQNNQQQMNSDKPQEDTKQEESEGDSEGGSEDKPENKPEEKPEEKPEQDTDVKSEYKLVWEDNFEGTELNRDDWNVELHAPGWVNAEWQEYVDSEENIYIKDGNLVIQAIKTGTGEDAYYTSGRVNTQNKHDYKYGKFEARIKVPSGKGFLPAFWMMPQDENFYGQWPKCGEIDIMEVMGQSTDTLHGTIHFGEPHAQSQGTYVLKSGDFSKEFHVFAVEWEPGEIRWYVDGILFHKENDWFSKKEGFDEISYPAPFDQPFHVILNLAVGGSWVGYPDETTEFGDNAQLVVDYVKIYQKDSYDESNVQKPSKAEVPDLDGNLLRNADFGVKEDLEAAEDWQFLTALGGVGKASVTADNVLKIESSDAGSVDYSVQFVQGAVPLKKGYVYKLSFDAWADADRTVITGITAPDLNYARYLNDTKFDITTDVKKYEFEFAMTSADDGNARVEFNLGNQGSTATVYLDNVVLEKVGTVDIPDDGKTILPDGNYVYNGEFQYGSDRFDYWETPETNIAGSSVSVTNINGVRELKVTVPDTVTALEQVIVEQKDIAIKGGCNYTLSFDAHADREKTIKAKVAGKEFEAAVTAATASYTYNFATEAELNGSTLQFLLGAAGTVYIDNVRIQEDGMLINGNFSNGLVGFDAYADASASAAFSVDELNEGGAACINISDTGDADWKIQLKQNDVTLEEAKWYQITFKAKAVTALGTSGEAFPRDIMCALQRNGAVHKNPDGSEDWTPYLQKTVSLTGEYQPFSFVFQMMPGTEPKTDTGTILTFSMGAVGGNRITDKHIVVIDDVVLEEVEAPEQEEINAGTELLVNSAFANNGEGWQTGSWGTGDAKVSFADGKAIYEIANVGTEDSMVKLNQKDMRLENGASYKVKFTITSTEDRRVKWGLMTDTYDWYTGGNVDLKANEPYEMTAEHTVVKPTTNAMNFYISMGQMYIEDENGVSTGVKMDTPASTIEISGVSVVKVSGGSADGSGEEPDGEAGGGLGNDEDSESTPGNAELIKNGNFASAAENWVAGINAPAVASVDYADNKATFTIQNVGTENWHLQFMQNNLSLENGKSYQVTFKMKSSAARDAKWALLDPANGYEWYGGETKVLGADEVTEISYELTVDKATSDTIQFQITLAPDWDSVNMPDGEHVIEISDVSVVKK